MVMEVAEMDSDTGADGLTVIVIELDVAGLFAVQDRLEVMTQETMSPFASPDVV